MMEIIKRVNQVTQIPLTSCRLLLTKYNWDKDRLMEAYFDQDQPDNLFKSSNMISPLTKHWHQARNLRSGERASSGPSPSTHDLMCDICCNNVPVCKCFRSLGEAIFRKYSILL